MSPVSVTSDSFDGPNRLADLRMDFSEIVDELNLLKKKNRKCFDESENKDLVEKFANFLYELHLAQSQCLIEIYCDFWALDKKATMKFVNLASYYQGLGEDELVDFFEDQIQRLCDSVGGVRFLKRYVYRVEPKNPKKFIRFLMKNKGYFDCQRLLMKLVKQADLSIFL